MIKTYPTYSSNPQCPSYGIYNRKYQLLKYKPWLHSIENAWGNQEGCDLVYIDTWHQFLTTTEAKQLVPNRSLQFDAISQYAEHLTNDIDDQESDTNEREEWMYLAELNLNTVSTKQQFEIPEGHWQIDRSKYTLQQIGEMPHWINIQKGIWSTKTGRFKHG